MLEVLPSKSVFVALVVRNWRLPVEPPPSSESGPNLVHFPSANVPLCPLIDLGLESSPTAASR